LKNLFTLLTENLDQSSELGKRYSIPGFMGLYSLYFTLYKDTSDKKFFKQCWDLQTKIPIIYLYGNTIFKIQPLLMQFFGNFIKLTGVVPTKLDKKYLTNFSNNFNLYVSKHYMNLITWMSRIESEYPIDNDKDNITIQTTLIIQGKFFYNNIKKYFII
jgi:hypothetical protein